MDDCGENMVIDGDRYVGIDDIEMVEAVTSDMESFTISSSDESTSSICEEIEDLIDKAHQLHAEIHVSHETLQTIQQLVAANKNIHMVHDGELKDFEDILEDFHVKAISTIRETGENNFGELLLRFLGSLDAGCEESDEEL